MSGRSHFCEINIFTFSQSSWITVELPKMLLLSNNMLRSMLFVFFSQMRKSNQNYYRMNILYHLSHCLYHWLLYCDRGCKFNWIIIRHCKSLPFTKNHNRDMNLFVREPSTHTKSKWPKYVPSLLKHNHMHMWTANKEEANDNMVTRMQIGHCRNTLMVWFLLTTVNSLTR